MAEETSWNYAKIRELKRWRNQIETFSVLLALCAGNSLVIGEFPSQRPATRSFDVFFDLRLNKRLNKQSIRRWCETAIVKAIFNNHLAPVCVLNIVLEAI